MVSQIADINSPTPPPSWDDFPALDDEINGLPNICGWEHQLRAIAHSQSPVFYPQSSLQFNQVSAAFAIALHMHQPTIPAGASGELICNLQYMFEHPYEGDNHNAGPFAYCYGRMADFIPDLIEQGCNPRIMLDYSGNLLWGLQQMGRADILDNLKRITCDPPYRNHVEWLGTMWSHAVVPSTPIDDIPLHIRAWQHHFASIFGWEALSRVRGFSPPEMHLPNDPDTCYAFIKALKECGYQWVLLQEHTVQRPDGSALHDPYIPHSLVTHNSQGERISIPALIKTQGSDTKLVGQMQPYYEAKTYQHRTLNGVSIPPLVTQISDGENGGVMMNEFPSAYRNAWYEMRDHYGGNHGVVGMNGTEYLEFLADLGLSETDFPTCQPIQQHRIWQRISPEEVTPDRLRETIQALRNEDSGFNLDGSSWTSNISWVDGYQNVTTPLGQLSQAFHTTIDPLQENDHLSSGDSPLTQQHRYRNALLHNLLLQTSCFRYWGQGTWTDYAREIYRRGHDILTHDF
ncbi:MAG: glycosyl hydrolase family 57 [Leptolyngbyaceae bacterium]|nr:glycosyl hydrolase family 57 [Leptolyngbyaceae bacterium]